MERLEFDMVLKLMMAFPGSKVEEDGAFSAYPRALQTFLLTDCKTELDIQCKVLEWLSRGAYKTQCFNSDKANRAMHKTLLEGINQYLGTAFTPEDMEEIYTHLGNRCNHGKTIAFIQSGYDMEVLRKPREAQL